jgi:hypothetical protein
MVKVVCDNVEPLKPYGYLIGEEVDYGKRKFFNRKAETKIERKNMK